MPEFIRSPKYSQWMPYDLHPLIESGILPASLSAALLNAFFNGIRSREEARRSAAVTTHGSE